MAVVINKTIEWDPDQWKYYRPRPSRFIHMPDSLLYKGNEEIVAAELEFAISENWWKSWTAMEHIDFLRSFGRVE